MKPGNIIRLLLVCVTLVPLVLSCAKTLPVPGVLEGENAFTKTSFFEGSGLGDICSISFGILDHDSLDVIVASGTKGAAVISPKGKLRRTIGFDRPMERTVTLDIDHDGACEFMGRGGNGAPVSLLNNQGQTVWEMSRIDSKLPVDMDACDLTGDRIPEFAVLLSGGSVRILNDTATEQAKWDGGNTASVAAAVLGGGGQPVLLTGMGKKTGIQVRDSSGKVLRTIDGICEPFALIGGAAGTPTSGIIGSVPNEPILRVVDPSGAKIAEYTVPAAGGMYMTAVPVHFTPGGEPFLAVAVTLSMKPGLSILTIRGNQGSSVYTEVFPTARLAVAAARVPDTEDETLLVGSGSQIWAMTPMK